MFGQKDALQCTTIRRLVRELAFPITVHVEPTVREHDGLAMSSRNARLTDVQRAEAPVIYRSLSSARALAAAGADAASVGVLKAAIAGILNENEAVQQVDYISFADPTTSEEMDDAAIAEVGTVISTAVIMKGSTLDPVRLLDNIVL